MTSIQLVRRRGQSPLSRTDKKREQLTQSGSNGPPFLLPIGRGECSKSTSSGILVAVTELCSPVLLVAPMTLAALTAHVRECCHEFLAAWRASTQGGREGYAARMKKKAHFSCVCSTQAHVENVTPSFLSRKPGATA